MLDTTPQLDCSGALAVEGLACAGHLLETAVDKGQGFLEWIEQDSDTVGLRRS